ncbi:MAG: methyltransferase domain-containing protein [Bradyrhizobium sp.]
MMQVALDRRSEGMGAVSIPPPLKPNYLAIQRQYGDVRPPERLIAHYELERRLSDRLRSASRRERPLVYTEIYSELFDRLPDHPQKTRRGAESIRVADRMRLLRPLLKPGAVYLEIGCGSAALPCALAGIAERVLGLDVTDALIDFAAAPSNFQFVRTGGVEISLRDGAVDLAHSDQLMEHLHVEDAEPQLREIYRVLKPGGQYLCTTPSRVTGPHDISVYFDEVPTGFHMREYDYGSLRALLLEAGFSRVRFPLVVRGLRLATPPYPVLRGIERALAAMPSLKRARISGILMGITALATK